MLYQREEIGSNSEVGVGVSHVFQEGIVFLADEGLAVMAGHVVPVHAIVVEVVQDGHAVLSSASLDQLLLIDRCTVRCHF